MFPRLALVLKTIFHQCVIHVSYTCSYSNSDYLFKTEPVNNPKTWIFQEHCQICIFKNRMRKLYIELTFPQKENNTFYLKISILKNTVSKFYYSKIIKYRTGNHRLPVETERWNDIPLNERKWKICTTDDIGDEYHFLFTCDFLRVTENYIWTRILCSAK